MPHKFADLVDISRFQELLGSLYQATGIPHGLIDRDGQILSAAGWQTICNQFHRSNPESARRCLESDAYITRHLDEGPFVGYACLNGLMDYAAPIMVDGEHLATVFLGQFLHEPPDETLFQRQALEFGFEEESYLAALRQVPIISQERVQAIMNYFSQLAQTLAAIGLERLRLLELTEGSLAAEEEIRRLAKTLEARIAERTAQLISANEELRYEIAQRQEVEQALRESEERFRKMAESLSAAKARYRSLVEQAPLIIYTFTTGTGTLPPYVSPQVETILGYQAADWMSEPRRRLDWVHPDDRSLVMTEEQKTNESLEPFRMEFRMLTRDGRTVWVHDEARVIRDTLGRPLYWQGVMTDITTQKRASEALHCLNNELEARVAERTRKLQKALNGSVEALASLVERKDPYTAGHQKRVAQLAMALAREIGLTAEQIEWIRIGGLLHDIGKVTVPTEVLNKPGRLNSYELQMIREHPGAGKSILEPVDFPEQVSQIVLQHHEWQDGHGYPAGLTAGEISLEACILAVADTVEAMSSHRPYREALGTDKAIEEITTHSGDHYNPLVVEACLKLFHEEHFSFQ